MLENYIFIFLRVQHNAKCLGKIIYSTRGEILRFNQRHLFFLYRKWILMVAIGWIPC